MKGKKILFLFLALGLPGCIFVFLKMFGKNQFDVEPLFQKDVPVLAADCIQPISVPYKLPDSTVQKFLSGNDSLAIVYFNSGSANDQSKRELIKLEEDYKSEPVVLKTIDLSSGNYKAQFNCVFLMKAPLDLVMIDNHGVIRGQYESSDRDEIDRLKTEVTIILRKY